MSELCGYMSTKLAQKLRQAVFFSASFLSISVSRWAFHVVVFCSCYILWYYWRVGVLTGCERQAQKSWRIQLFHCKIAEYYFNSTIVIDHLIFLHALHVTIIILANDPWPFPISLPTYTKEFRESQIVWGIKSRGLANKCVLIVLYLTRIPSRLIGAFKRNLLTDGIFFSFFFIPVDCCSLTQVPMRESVVCWWNICFS